MADVVMESSSNASVKVPLLPYFPFQTEVESNFNALGMADFIQRNYHHSLYYAAVYLLAIPVGQAFMKKRAPLELGPWMFLWNGILALMSLAGALRTVPELLHSLKHFGLEHSICDDRYYYISSVMACWCHVIVASKVLELFDTLFIILRKQKLIFLHWFHHSTVLIFTWVIAKDRCAVTRWYMSMNYTIHAMMYAYFALRSLKIQIPRFVAAFITTSQILQMIIGLFVSLLGLHAWYTGKRCSLSGRVAVFSSALYTFYFVLFVQFFISSYVLTRFRKSKKTD